MMKRAVAFAIAALIIACDGTTPTSETVVTQPTQPVVSSDNKVGTPTTVLPSPEPAGAGWEGYIKPFGGWFVRNVSGIPQLWTAYYTDFDNQSLSRGSTQFLARNGDFFEGTFNKTCIQVDITNGAPGDTPFLAGFIDHEGRVVRANQIDRAKCTPKVEPRCENVTSGSFKVYADTHLTGTFLYRVREDSIVGNIVWEGNLAKGTTYTQTYPINGKKLYVSVRTVDLPGPVDIWEFGEYTVAKCAEVGAAWNEDISFSCQTQCVFRQGDN